MRVFVTGATGFIGSAVVGELLKSGHQVVGLVRSENKAAALTAHGAEIVLGTLDDLDALRSAASKADAVAHLAFNHDFSKFEENSDQDHRAILAMGEVLAGSDRPIRCSRRSRKRSAALWRRSITDWHLKHHRRLLQRTELTCSLFFHPD